MIPVADEAQRQPLGGREVEVAQPLRRRCDRHADRVLDVDRTSYGIRPQAWMSVNGVPQPPSSSASAAARRAASSATSTSFNSRGSSDTETWMWVVQVGMADRQGEQVRGQQRLAGRLPELRLRLQPFELRELAGHQVAHVS